MTYGKRTLIAVDQLINTLLGGWPDEFGGKTWKFLEDNTSKTC